MLIVSIYPLPMDRIRPWFSQSVPRPLSSNLLRPCTSFRVTNMWNVTIPKRSTESSIRTVDVNEDGIQDMILGYQTGSFSNIILKTLKINRNKTLKVFG